MAGKYGDMYDDFFGSTPSLGKHREEPVAAAGRSVEQVQRSVEQMQEFLNRKTADLTRELAQDGLLEKRPAPAAKAKGTAPVPPESWQESAKAVGEALVGQQEFLAGLARAFRRPAVLGKTGSGCRNVILICGGQGSGRHTALEKMTAALAERGALENGTVARMNLALYPGPAQEKLFLQDLYAVLNGSAAVVAFDGWQSCAPSCRSVLSALVVEGKAPLSSRYVMQRGILVDSGTALVKDAVGSLTPGGKYFVFFGGKGIASLAESFGASFAAAVGDVCTTADYSPETLSAIAGQQLNALSARVRERLELTLSAGAEVRDWLSGRWCKAAGVAGIVEGAEQIFRALAEYKLTRDPASGTAVMLAAAESGLTVTVGENAPIGLAALLPQGWTGERAEAEAALAAVVGLAPVKDYVHSLADNVEAQTRRRAAGLPTAPVSMHMIFAGNPGTGKTTIARIVAKYLKAIGALRGGQLVEVTRADLVGRYVGHTAPLTNSVIQSALGGVLFIDEAYSLFRGREDSFGLEAIDTLVKGMEDHRDDLVVVLAGYSREMSEFLTANSGLASRFPNRIEFPDYSGQELLDITHSIAKSKGYRLDTPCDIPLLGWFEAKQATAGKDGGNGRMARNLLEKAILNQSRRLAADPEAPLDLLLVQDFPLEDTGEI